MTDVFLSGSPESVNDGKLSILVEDMELVGIDSEGYLITGSCGGRRIYTCGHGRAAEIEIQHQRIADVPLCSQPGKDSHIRPDRATMLRFYNQALQQSLLRLWHLQLPDYGFFGQWMKNSPADKSDLQTCQLQQMQP